MNQITTPERPASVPTTRSVHSTAAGFPISAISHLRPSAISMPISPLLPAGQSRLAPLDTNPCAVATSTRPKAAVSVIRIQPPTSSSRHSRQAITGPIASIPQAGQPSTV